MGGGAGASVAAFTWGGSGAVSDRWVRWVVGPTGSGWGGVGVVGDG